MGTEKRERQRQNKAVKEQEAARAETRQKTTRLSLIIVGAIVAVFAIAFAANTFIGDDDDADGGSAGAGATLPSAEPLPTIVDDATGEVVPEGCPPPEGTAEQTQTFDSPPPQCIDPTVSYRAVVDTNKGEFTIDLDQDRAPGTVNNFVFLARNGYFNDTTCHRIIPGFVVQCGDPDGTGRGGPGYQFADELPAAGEYAIGSLAMANSGTDTNGSQFFIITGPQGVQLPPLYSLFGEVTDGFDETVVPMEAAGTAAGTPNEPIEINSVTILVS